MQMQDVLKTGALLVVLAILSLCCGGIAGFTCAKSASGFARNLRRDVFSSLQTFAFSNIDKFSTSSLVTRLTTDISQVQMSFMMIIRIAVRCPVMLILSVVMAFRIHAGLAAIFLVALPVLAVGIIVVMTTVHPLFKQGFKLYDKLNLVVQENLRGIRVVKSFVREDYEAEKFEGVSGSIFKLFRKAV